MKFNLKWLDEKKKKSHRLKTILYLNDATSWDWSLYELKHVRNDSIQSSMQISIIFQF